MNKEIDHIEKNKTWSLIPRPEGKNVIGTKWVFNNKLDENGEVTRKKIDWLAKDMHKKKELTTERHFPSCKIGRSKNYAFLLCIQRF